MHPSMPCIWKKHFLRKHGIWEYNTHDIFQRSAPRAEFVFIYVGMFWNTARWKQANDWENVSVTSGYYSGCKTKANRPFSWSRMTSYLWFWSQSMIGKNKHNAPKNIFFLHVTEHEKLHREQFGKKTTKLTWISHQTLSRLSIITWVSSSIPTHAVPDRG